MAKALVLGATGHIGAHIVRALLSEGHHVRAAFRSERHLDVLNGLPVERARVDLDNLYGLDEALDGCEWVFHAAGYYPRYGAHRQRAIEQGVISIRRAMAHIHKANPKRVVFTSSTATIQQLKGRACNENHPEPWPLTTWLPLYATVKIAMEQEVLRICKEGLPVVVVNPAVCIGEYDAHKFSGRIVLLFAKYRSPFYIQSIVNVIYTGDAGIGHVRAAALGRIGERYILSTHSLALREIAHRIASICGIAPPRLPLPYWVALAAATGSECLAWLARSEPLLPRQAVHAAYRSKKLDGSKALRELGLPQRPINEAIERCLYWFREHGDL